MKVFGKDNQAKCAIVLFRSVEGFRRAEKAFSVPWYKKVIFKCIKQTRLKEIRFHSKFLRVNSAVEPDLVLWQNFGVSKKNRFVRVFLFVIFTFILLGICFFGILKLEHFIQKTDQSIPS